MEKLVRSATIDSMYALVNVSRKMEKGFCGYVAYITLWDGQTQFDCAITKKVMPTEAQAESQGVTQAESMLSIYA